MTERPCLVWLPMDHRLGDHDHKMPYLVLGDKYVRATKVGATAQPVLFPLTEVQRIPDLLALVDGVMLTGSASNIHPSHLTKIAWQPLFYAAIFKAFGQACRGRQSARLINSEQALLTAAGSTS